MKQSTKALIVSGLTLAASATTLFGQGNPLFTFDENGNGNFNGTPLPFTVGSDPSGGVTTSPVLIYFLPFPVVSGDVGLLEPNDPTRSASDIIRFFSPAGAQSMLIFYSDFSATDPADSLADSGLPSSSNPILINEVGPEGNNGALWAPLPGQPGSNSAGAQYNFISDSVPEPGTASLLLSGVGVLFAIRRFGRMDRSPASNLQS